MSGIAEDQRNGRFELTRARCDCGDIPCVWEANVESMRHFAEARNDEEATLNQQRPSLYRQMALIINDGPSGRGNRVKLPSCVVSSVRELFSDPASVYTGHVEKAA
jgi:hypothetical protein